MPAVHLDPCLARDTTSISRLGLCDLRLMNDSRWPWLILVPQRNAITEFHELTPLDQTMLTFEMGLVSKALQSAVKADKMNIGALGNIVPMFHLHVVARRKGDPNWPGPIWGHGTPVPYDAGEAARFADEIRRAILPA